MLDNIKVEDIMFLDIETVPQEAGFENVAPEMQELWEKKSAYFRNDDESPADVYGRAGIYAEFGKIVCMLKKESRYPAQTAIFGFDQYPVVQVVTGKQRDNIVQLQFSYDFVTNPGSCSHVEGI